MTERDDYLWDPAEAPDPEVERLEGLLSRYRYAPGSPPALETPPTPSDPRPAAWGRLAAPLGVLAAAALALLMVQLRGDPELDAPRVGYVVRGGDQDFAELGSTFVASEDVVLDIGALGDVRLAAGARVRVDAVEDERHALYLHEGRLRAFILAEPRVFQVGSPAGLTIDLGCEYTLDVARDGTTALSVLTGQVAFGGLDGREVYVPAGASCVADADGRVSPPIFDDARPEFRDAVALAASGELFASKAGLGELLEFTDRDEGLPLFALLSDPQVPDWARGVLFDALARGFQLPPGATREGVLSGDVAQLADWIQASRYWWRRGATKKPTGQKALDSQGANLKVVPGEFAEPGKRAKDGD